MSTPNQMHGLGRRHIPRILVLLLAGAACTKGSPKPKGDQPNEQAAEQVKELPESKAQPAGPQGEDAVVSGCMAQYPKQGRISSRIDEQRAWEICMDASGNQAGLCDTTAMLPLDCAVCIAKGKGLPLTENWRVRLEFIPAPRPRVLWMLSLLDTSMQMSIDAHSGELVARWDQRKQNEAVDPHRVAMSQELLDSP